MKIRFVCALWGDPFVDLFWRVAVRSLLAPGNAIDVARAYPARLSIITTRKDADQIRSSPSFARLNSTLPIDFTIIGPLDTDRSDRASHVVLWRVALDESRRLGEVVVFVVPDVVYPRGAIARWVERFGAGAAAVFTPSLQVVCETALPELEQRFPDPATPIDVDDAAAGTFGLRHLHPLWIAHVRGSPRASFLPEYLMRAAGSGVSIRLLALFPIGVNPQRGGLDAGTNSTAPIAWDPATLLSLEPACKQLDRYFRGNSLDQDAMTRLGGWFDEVDAVEHPVVGVDFAAPPRAPGDPLLRATASAADFFVTQSRLSRRIHRVWRAMHRLGCHDAARVLAAAHMILPLRRRWRHRGPVTLLVPRVTMRDSAAAAAVHDALATGHEPALAALIDAHVVLGDVTLRPGAGYSPIETAANQPGVHERFTTAAGVTFAVCGAPLPGMAIRVLDHVAADGISIYAIDRVLLPPRDAHPPQRQRTPPPAARPMETTPLLDPWLMRLRRRTAITRHRAGWRRLATIARWMYHEVLAAQPPLPDRLGARMRRRRLGGVERRALDEAFTLLGLDTLSELAVFHETMGVHGTGESPLRRELERIAPGPAEAERRLRQVVAANPDVAEAWLGLGYLSADRGEVDEALECFAKAVAGRPHLVPRSSMLLPAAVAASARGRLLEEAGRMAEAEASYSEAIAAGARPEVCGRYARLLRARGALDEACVYFDRAVGWDDRAHPFPALPRLLDDIAGTVRAR